MTTATSASSAPTTRTIQVVVGFDFTESSEAALDRAVTLAHRAGLHVFHFACIIDHRAGVAAVPAEGKFDHLYADKVQEHVARRVEAAFAANRVSDSVEFFVHARFGDPAKEILLLAQGVGADLIIVGSKGITGIERVLLGSVSESIVRSAGCGVMVARPKTYPDVELLKIFEVEPLHEWVKPHRYSYIETRVIKRPLEWPLY